MCISVKQGEPVFIHSFVPETQDSAKPISVPQQICTCQKILKHLTELIIFQIFMSPTEKIYVKLLDKEQ